jgi:hypothetical protein
MKKVISTFLILMIFFLSFLAFIGFFKWQAHAASVKGKSQANLVGKVPKENTEFSLEDEKNKKFIVLVGIIKQNLIEKYQIMEDQETEEDYLQFFEAYSDD